MKTLWRNGKFFVLAGLLLVMFGTILAQFPKLPEVPKGLSEKLPGLDKILKKEPPVTTGLSDAVTEVPFLDDYNPQTMTPMVLLPRTRTGAFVLAHPGAYFFDCESYCLRAGTYAPGRGDGYLYAPLKGPQADIVRHVLQGAYTHPEIPQRDIQVLLWAIIARTKLNDMSQKMQMTAAKLLTPKEIFEINGGALELIPKQERDKAFASLPSQVRKILEAEAQLREMLTQGETHYEQLEQVAVILGDAPPGEGSRTVPSGRWSYHPDGYFIRYFVSGYPRTQVQISVPGHMEIERDTKGRIALIADDFGNRIEVEYDDTIEPLSVRGDPAIRGYAISLIRFVRRDIFHPEVVFYKKLELKKAAWTFVGVPSGKGTIGTGSSRFADAQARYIWAKHHKKNLDYLDKQFRPHGSIRDIVDLGHFSVCLNKVLKGHPAEGTPWVIEHVNLVKVAWQYAVAQREGGHLWGCVAAPQSSYATAQPNGLQEIFASLKSFVRLFVFANPGGGNKPEYDPTKNVAAPGNTSKQREGKSPRPSKKQAPCDQVKLLQKYSEFARKRANYYKKFANQANSSKELDKMVNDAMAKEFKQKEASGEIKTEGEQRSGGHYEPCTDKKFVHNICQFVKEKPLCDWLTRGTNRHEDVHQQDAHDFNRDDPWGFKEYCRDDSPEGRKKAAKIDGDWEHHAYNEEADFYDAILDSLKKEHPECFE